MNKKYTYLLLLTFTFSLTSCKFLTPTNYNQGYSDGYHAGYEAAKKQHANSPKVEDMPKFIPNTDKAKTNDNKKEVSTNIPPKVYQVLDFIKKEDHAPDGYVGGRFFGNFEHHLPEQDAAGSVIKYREWDVNPKEEGKNRGAQRLITGSDGRAWYTEDHYNSFIEVISKK